ncbi:hypothetical protein ACLUTX_08675 [Enterobacterales bacterium AE_CKDN230030158-1A_HGKHYDSX7]
MSGLREERALGRRLARRISGMFERKLERRAVLDERFQRSVVRHGRCGMKTWRIRLALTPTLSRGEKGLGGAGWRVWSTPVHLLSGAP